MSTGKVNNKVSYIHVAIMLILTFGIGFLPPFGQITEMGMKVLGVFAGLIYGWIFIDLLWTSLFGFVALGLTGQTTVMGAFASGFGNATLLICLVVAVFSEALNRIGITQTIAYWLLSRKMFVGRPWLLVFAICFITIILGVAGGSFAAVFLLWNVVITIGELGGYKKGAPIISLLIGMILFLGFGGGQIVPFQSAPLLYAGFMPAGFEIQAVPFFVLGLIEISAVGVIMLLVAKFILKVDASNFVLTEELSNQYAQIKSNKYQKAGLILLVAYFIVLFMPSLFPTAPFSPLLSSIGIMGFSFIYIFIFAAWKKEDGESVIDVLECFKHGIPWAVMALFAVTFPLSSALQSPDTGVLATINATFVPMFSSLSPGVFLIACAIVLGLITQVLHNVVLAAIFMPFLAPVYATMGGDLHTFYMVLYLVLQAAYATPAGCMAAGLLFGHEQVTTKNAYLFGGMFVIVNMIVVLCMIPAFNMFFAG